MKKVSGSFLDTAFYLHAIRRWARIARNAGVTDLAQLRRERGRARLLKAHLDRLIHTADERLALPIIGSTSFPKPHNADWAWRPELWRGPLATPGMSSVGTKSMLGSEVTLFHDCDYSELTLRQLRNLREADLAPYGLRMDVFRFDGSFLSLVIDLPDVAVHGLKRTHLLRVSAIIEMEKPIEIFARLNIRHGPNTEQIVRELPLNEGEITVEFDLAYSNLNEKRVEKAWIDLIFEGPQMNQVVLRDLTFARRPRAQL
ncbi:DUF6478 family protein [Sulfitobacter sabulilitoris]|uniref:Uncharacterized protein n=1 Tax=Sulfitobacter sabulilitoris TaxID=2562655 RepID=A0A5S3PEG7_9RHOB|nr:DUF6478 family protein [Sulfitobacter sabulilitoris]TMM52450.1 hypothetical protein FDT80_09215 [Sulfitobacter sabulilitoris]